MWFPIVRSLSDSSNTVNLTLPIGIVRLVIEKGVGLFNTSITSDADPYCRIRSGQKNLGKTKIIDCNLNPKWGDVFYLPVQRPQQKFQLEVYDWNQLTPDALIGSTILEVNKLIERKDGYFNSLGCIEL